MIIALSCLSLTLIVYWIFVQLQRTTKLLWLNPMLLSMLVIIPVLLLLDISFNDYMSGGQWLSYLLEPAVVALGFPLYQQFGYLKQQWLVIVSILLLACLVAISISFTLAMLFNTGSDVAVSMALKSITTPIALELSQLLNGIDSITALAIIIAGISGGLMGPAWLRLLGVTNAKAQGLAIGAGSHVFGTAAISKLSAEHGAYGAIALILCAFFTALISPVLIPYLMLFF